MINVYAVKDVKAAFWSPFTMTNDAVAKREFALMCRNPQVSIYVNDLQLWRLGEYDEHTGNIVSFPEYVCSSADVCSAPTIDVPNEVVTVDDDEEDVDE